MNIQELKISPEFEAVIPPLGEEEFKQLEDNILQDGEVFTPIFAWNGLLIDGHHRYKILQKHPEIPYRVVNREFENRYAVIAWICNNQLGRRNLTDTQKVILIGRRYEAEKSSRGGDRKSGCEKSNCHCDSLISDDKNVAKKIAAELNIGERTVMRYGEFVRGLDEAERICPGIADEIASEKITPPQKQVAAIAKATGEEKLQLTEALRTAEEERRKEAQRKREERAAKRAMMEEIDRLAAEHGNMDRPPVSIESHLQSFTLTAERFLGTCDSYFADVPELLANETHRASVMVTGEKFIQYFTKIKEDRYEPYII